jgi:hypothetical protein
MKKTTAVEVDIMVNSLLLSSVSVVSHLCIETAPEACKRHAHENAVETVVIKKNWTGLIPCLLF